jgi:murein DD-endopeptidase MepM/ murein hydrolase activator NlpD
MKLYYPFKSFVVSQKFGENANNSYATAIPPLKGHTGIDLVAPWGTEIKLAHDGWVYKIINFNNPDLGYYRCVFTIIEDDLGLFELSYGHCNTCLTAVGSQIRTGTSIATEGNTGLVFYGTEEPTSAQKAAGNHDGTHLHFQLRPVELVDTVNNLEAANGHYLTIPNEPGGNYLKSPSGKFYHIKNFNNGYNGTIDPEPFFSGQYAEDIQIEGQIVQIAGNAVNIIANSNEPNPVKVDWLDKIGLAIAELLGFIKDN